LGALCPVSPIDPPAQPIRQIVAGELNLISELTERIAEA
jgi:hypothetical protein